MHYRERSVQSGEKGKKDHARAGNVIMGRNQGPAPSSAQILLLLQEAS